MGPLQVAMRDHLDAWGWTVADAIRHAGKGSISPATWSLIANGKPGNYEAKTYAAIDRAFDWDHGTALALQRGERAIPKPGKRPDGDEDRIDILQREVTAMRREFQALLKLLQGRLPTDGQ